MRLIAIRTLFEKSNLCSWSQLVLNCPHRLISPECIQGTLYISSFPCFVSFQLWMNTVGKKVCRHYSNMFIPQTLWKQRPVIRSLNNYVQVLIEHRDVYAHFLICISLKGGLWPNPAFSVLLHHNISWRCSFQLHMRITHWLQTRSRKQPFRA